MRAGDDDGELRRRRAQVLLRAPRQFPRRDGPDADGADEPRRADGVVEELDADGTPLGLLDNARYTETVTSLRRGETLLLYTDGVVEARGESGELLGDERLKAIVASSSSPGELTDLVLSAVSLQLDGGPRPDDVTLLAVSPA